MSSFERVIPVNDRVSYNLSPSYHIFFFQSRIETPKKEVAYYTTHSVYANIKLVVCNTTDDAQVFLSLYDAKEERFIRYQHMCIRN